MYIDTNYKLRMENYIHFSARSQKKPRVAILISEKVEMRTKYIARQKEEGSFIMIKR